MADAAAPLASFESKWSAAHPELGLALGFVDARRRDAQAAWACLGFELEHAAFALGDAEPAAIKLQWWAEELAGLGRGVARHPLTQALLAQPRVVEIAPARWAAAIGGAFAQRDAEPAASRDALLDGYAALYGPLAEIESTLFGAADAPSLARAQALARALRETAMLAQTLRAGRLPVPLDLLARHRLARGDLARAAPAQAALLREWLAALAAELARLRGRPLGVVGAAAAAANRVRARRAGGAADPLAALSAGSARLPFAAVWAAWRAGRRSPH
ncbi:MAG TPA: hypothetical protein VGC30_14710 [Dokdonella sp.]